MKKIDSKNIAIISVCLGILLFITITAATTNGGIAANKPINSTKKILPVCVLLNGAQKGELYFYLLAALKKHSIKVISKTDADELSYFEMKSVYEEYFRTRTTERADFEEIKRHTASQMSYVANVLEVKCKIDTLNNTLDSIKFTVIPIPYNHGNPYKNNWVYLNKGKQTPTFELFSELIDSVLSKRMLIQEK
ncbi:hypothetical protein [Ferruginibacter sp.]|nr:hypothetical protein [Ferruginibacter sp.]